MVSFLRRVLTSCSITRACWGATNVAVVSTLPNSLLREPVSQDWPLVYLELLAQCPEAEDRQGTAALAALETPKRLANFSALLRLRAEETERSARWRLLHPGTLAGLAD